MGTRPLARTTLIAAVVIIAFEAVAALIGLVWLLTNPAPGLIVFSVSAWTLMLGVLILRRRAWARWAAIVTFELFALITLAVMILFRNRLTLLQFLIFLLAFVLDEMVVSLLASRATARDFRRLEERLPVALEH